MTAYAEGALLRVSTTPDQLEKEPGNSSPYYLHSQRCKSYLVLRHVQFLCDGLSKSTPLFNKSISKYLEYQGEV